MKNENSPAFPISEEETDRIDQGIKIYTGLTKREHFAAMAMQGLISEINVHNYKDLAEYSVRAADALLKELEQN